MPRDLFARQPRDLLAELTDKNTASATSSSGMAHGTGPEFVPIGKDGKPLAGYDPKTGEMHRVASRGDAFGQGAADAAALGFADELAAVPGSMISGDSYDKVLSEMRGLNKEAQAQHPGYHLAGQVTGALADAVATRGATFLPNAESVIGRLLGGALTGGAYGAAHGFGSGEETLADRGEQAAKEGGLGAFAGAILPTAFSALGSGARAVIDRLLGRSAARLADASPEAVRILTNVLEADGTRGPAGRANIAAAGPGAMVADAGPTARAVLDTAIQKAGPGALAAREAVAGRTTAAAQQIDDALNRTFGNPEGVTATRTAIRQGSKAARGTAYDAAYASPIDYTSPQGMALEQIVLGRVPAAAIRRANELMRAEGVQSQQILARIGDDGAVTFERLPDVRQLDYITRALNDVASSSEGTGALGGQNALGRVYQGLSREIRDGLRGLVPEYGTALDTAADPIRRSQAVELGSRLLSPGMSRDQVVETIAGMSQAERAALAQGIRSQIDDTLANVKRSVTDGDMNGREAVRALKELSSRASREKLALAIGQDQADALFRDLDQAAHAFDLRASVAQNSKTFARQETDRLVTDMTDPGLVGKLGEGKPLDATRRVIQLLTRQTPADRAERQQRIYAEVARLLTRPANQNAPLFQAIDSTARGDQLNAAADRVVRALSSSYSIYPAATLLENRAQRR